MAGLPRRHRLGEPRERQLELGHGRGSTDPDPQPMRRNGFDVTGATQVKPEATFTAKLAASSPAGMPFVNPFRLTLINTHATAAF